MPGEFHHVHRRPERRYPGVPDMLLTAGAVLFTLATILALLLVAFVFQTPAK